MTKAIRVVFEALIGLMFLSVSCVPLIIILDEKGENPMKDIKDKIIGCLFIAGIIALLIAMVVCIIIELWVVSEYGDMPITEVPSWAIPWLT